MKITILTLFDGICKEYLNTSIIKRAIQENKVEIEVINFREFSSNKHKSVDDYQVGGGPGMVISIEPIVKCIESIKKTNSYILLTTPSGKTYNQQKALELSKLDHIVIIAGHYEGFDARIENFINDEVSIGDYILTGGELASLVIVDSIVRLLPDVISSNSLLDESFNNNLLDYPVYTKPLNFRGYKVPEILLTGNHKKIEQYRHEERIRVTKLKRRDLYEKYLKERKEDEN